MVNHKRFIEIARKWQKMSVLGRRRILFSGRGGGAHLEGKPSKLARKGHIVVQSLDGEKFMVPLAYLDSIILRELFKMSEEEFGLPSEGPIRFPCNAVFVEYALSLLRKRVAKDVERALFNFVTTSSCSALSDPARKLPTTGSPLWLLN